MLTTGTEIFRCMDHGFGESNIRESINQLKSHLEHGVLSPFEQQIKGVVSKTVMNLISPHYISVYGGEKYEEIFTPIKSIGLNIFAGGSLHIIGIIIECPYRPNDEIATDGTKHNIIDSREVPIEDRKISGIVVNLEKLSKKDIKEILVLGKKYNIPVYTSDLISKELSRIL